MRDCFECRRSMVTENDELYCSLYEKIVDEEDVCEFVD